MDPWGGGGGAGAREPWVWDKWPSEGPLNYEADQREGPWDVQWCGAGGENQIKHHLFSEAGRLNRTSQETHLWRRRAARGRKWVGHVGWESRSVCSSVSGTLRKKKNWLEFSDEVCGSLDSTGDGETQARKWMCQITQCRPLGVCCRCGSDVGERTSGEDFIWTAVSMLLPIFPLTLPFTLSLSPFLRLIHLFHFIFFSRAACFSLEIQSERLHLAATQTWHHHFLYRTFASSTFWTSRSFPIV